jgi:hypothetical protein
VSTNEELGRRREGREKEKEKEKEKERGKIPESSLPHHHGISIKT